MRGRLGGIGYSVGNYLDSCMGVEVRVTVLGHVQRGGQPTPHDRWLATRFGSEAVNLAAREAWGMMAALQGEKMVSVPMLAATELKLVDPDGELVRMARDLGIEMG